MTADPATLAAVEAACDEPRAFVLALLEHLQRKTQNYGSVRACEPIVSADDAAKIVGRVPEIVRELAAERKKAAGIMPSGLFLPPGAVK